MLSYRHGFHAGNHADVLKHLTLCLLLRHLSAKDKPYCVIDTHAGAGTYDLSDRFASVNREFAGGVAEILADQGLKAAVPEYFDLLKKLNPQASELSADTLRYYPGSPCIEAALTRECDRLTLLELHHHEFQNLLVNMGRDRRITIRNEDAFKLLPAILPPPIRRGLIFIDPSYEMAGDYFAVVKAIKVALTRFNTCQIALWYPVLSAWQDDSRRLVQEIRRLGVPLLQAELNVRQKDETPGMSGSGMLLLNYPYKLDEELETVMGGLYARLAAPHNGSARLKVLVEHP